MNFQYCFWAVAKYQYTSWKMNIEVFFETMILNTSGYLALVLTLARLPERGREKHVLMHATDEMIRQFIS